MSIVGVFSADERIQEKRDANALVYSSGIVYWLPQSVIKSSCNINITMFPYDIQECKLVWGSWTYETRRLNLTYYNNLTQMALEDFIDNPEWAIVENKAFYTNNWYDCCDAYYNRLVFLLKLRRNVAFYSYILIVPCVLLSSITLVLFWIPPESPAKMQLGRFLFSCTGSSGNSASAWFLSNVSVLEVFVETPFLIGGIRGST